MLWLRGPGITWITWQPSHTGGTSTTARLLAEADAFANAARQCESDIPEYTFFEERLIWSRRDLITGVHHPILGDIRKAIADQLELSCLLEWGRLDTQGTLIRAALQLRPSSAHHLLRACKKIRSIRLDPLRSYAAIALSYLLPTEYRLHRLRARRAGGAGLPPDPDAPNASCRLCNSGQDETMPHVLTCQALGPQRLQTRLAATGFILASIPRGTPRPAIWRLIAIIRMMLSDKTQGDRQAYLRLSRPPDQMTTRVICDWPPWLLHLGIAPPELIDQFVDSLARMLVVGSSPWGLKGCR